MRLIDCKLLPEVKIIEPEYFFDARGYFAETYSKKKFEKVGIITNFVQDNHSYSTYKNTIRGFHFQNNPQAQIKLIRCIKGKILDVAVDLRRNSVTYKKYVSVILSEDNKRQIYIPEGFAHGFITLTDNCEVIYKVDKFYDANLDRSVAWNDPERCFEWGISHPILSEKDREASYLKDSDINF